MKTIILILSLFAVVGCDNDDDGNTNFQSTEITPVEIGKGALYGNGSEEIPQSNLVIEDETNWQNLLEQMNTNDNVSDSFSETDIDFNNYMVIAVFLEIKPTGWEVEINSIVENENNITITTEEVEFASAVITQPFHIVKIPITDKEIILNN